ncbi:MAG: NAD-dependent epimerase/dehydratase family protein [Candidatus Acididesulfobacter diazotrophicus]|uniref:NAD-dependent epimerase/dehydratase family protein n=1 Tax=Candidatus Acididesulfobacter diazotrophicus TaxID=2597226 RepID=A0A519BKS4_9DELT|nr:MAG: NAD-dependent epimerase/dehydratase family protein [Candidatus Acididesulfobacter diazotrophicus]
MEKNSNIYIAGHKGLVGSSILRELVKRNYNKIIYKTSKELDLIRQADTENFFEANKPEYVYLCAGKVALICGVIKIKDI